MSKAREFQLRAGSVAARVIEFLESAPAATRLSRDEIAEQFGAVAANVTTLLSKPVEHGLLAYTSEGRTRYYHLPVSEDPAEVAPEKTGPLERLRFYEDGDLSFAGCTIDAEGNVLLKPKQLQQILNFVQRAPVDLIRAPAVAVKEASS